MDQLFRSSDVISKAVDALLGELTGERRLARMRYAQSGVVGGRYGDVLRGWQGQAELIRARLTKEVLATRLDSSSGQELKDLAKSEYFAEIPSEPRKAVGAAVIERVIVNESSSTSGTFAAGVIPTGTRIKRTVPSIPRVPASDAEFLTLAPVTCSVTDSHTQFLGGTSWRHQQEFTVPVEATREGPHANLAWYDGSAVNTPNPRVGTIASSVFDPTFTATDILTAGGTLGVVDDQIRALARAMAIGSGGPTALAALAGALTNPSVRRTAYVEDPANATGRLYVADESWASSERYREAALQELRAYPWIGWGCRVQLFGVLNRGITVRPTVLLRSRGDVSAQDAITTNISAALKDYFDERPDWWTWTLNAIGGTVGVADDRILACTAVSVFDAAFGWLIASVDSAGTITGTEPPAVLDDQADPAIHYAIVDQGVTPLYQYPGG